MLVPRVQLHHREQVWNDLPCGCHRRSRVQARAEWARDTEVIEP